MSKFKVLVCREIWGTIEVEADSAEEAQQKVIDYEYESEFEPNGKTGSESIYRADLIGEGTDNE